MRRRGFTLIEVIITLTLLVAVTMTATLFYRGLQRDTTRTTQRFDAQRNASLALMQIERDLRFSGMGVLPAQPMIVLADPYAIVFNANITTNTSVAGDPAVYVDVDAAESTVGSMRPADKLTLPRQNPSSRYPDSLNRDHGLPSNAETVAYWVQQDVQTKVAGQVTWTLYRRVNAEADEVLAEGLLVPTAFFRYFVVDAAGAMQEVAQNSLPWRKVNMRGSAADTGKSAALDAIRAVRVQATGVFRDVNNVVGTRPADVYVRLLNAGLINRTTCGNAPAPSLFAGGLPSGTNSQVTDSTGTYLQISEIPRVADDGAGEQDVERYLVLRRSVTLAGVPLGDWAIIGSVDPVARTLGYRDYEYVRPNTTDLEYAVLAQDCAPQNSSLMTYLRLP